jgi:hypothetical protein
VVSADGFHEQWINGASRLDKMPCEGIGDFHPQSRWIMITGFGAAMTHLGHVGRKTCL